MPRFGLLLLGFFLACGDDDLAPVDAGADATAPDAGPRDGGPPRCTSDSECEDDAFCDGVPRCDPASPFANVRGCVAPSGPPCDEGLFCDETTDRCLTACERSGDADEDDFVSEACGGADCDDTDDAIFPGAAETCDEVDEDCDGTFDEGAGDTYFRDLDGDGFGAGDPVALCAATEGYVTLGTDCDDTRMDVSPSGAELCDAELQDEDCDGLVNEGC